MSAERGYADFLRKEVIRLDEQMIYTLREYCISYIIERV